MSGFIYGFDPHAVQSTGTKKATAQVPTKRELLKIGIPTRKVERIQQELVRLAAADATLDDKTKLIMLAKELEKRFV